MKASLRLLVCTLAALCLVASASAAAATNDAAAKPSKEELTKQFEATKAKAESGDPRAQYSLAGCYAQGSGVLTNNVEAHVWFTLAIEKIPMASIARAEVEKKMSTEDLRASRMRFREVRATIEAGKKAAGK